MKLSYLFISLLITCLPSPPECKLCERAHPHFWHFILSTYHIVGSQKFMQIILVYGQEKREVSY